MSQFKIHFDTSENIKKHKIKNVKLMITSPPYWDLKNYEAKNQIGYNEDYETYLKRVNKVWKNTFDVLKKDGIAIININTKAFKSSLKLLPYDFVKQMKKIGFYFKDLHYWHKSSGIPATNNLKDNFEYFLIFSKSKKTIYKEDIDYFDYKLSFRPSKSNIWNVNKKFGSVGKKFMIHPAVFPVPYISRMLEIFTNEGDLIMDPFLGSGTTLISCMQSNRKFVGFELNNKEYKNLIKENLKSYKLNYKLVKIN